MNTTIEENIVVDVVSAAAAADTIGIDTITDATTTTNCRSYKSKFLYFRVRLGDKLRRYQSTEPIDLVTSVLPEKVNGPYFKYAEIVRTQPFYWNSIHDFVLEKTGQLQEIENVVNTTLLLMPYHDLLWRINHTATTQNISLSFQAYIDFPNMLELRRRSMAVIGDTAAYRALCSKLDDVYFSKTSRYNTCIHISPQVLVLNPATMPGQQKLQTPLIPLIPHLPTDVRSVSISPRPPSPIRDTIDTDVLLDIFYQPHLELQTMRQMQQNHLTFSRLLSPFNEVEYSVTFKDCDYLVAPTAVALPYVDTFYRMYFSHKHIIYYDDSSLSNNKYLHYSSDISSKMVPVILRIDCCHRTNKPFRLTAKLRVFNTELAVDTDIMYKLTASVEVDLDLATMKVPITHLTNRYKRRLIIHWFVRVTYKNKSYNIRCAFRCLQRSDTVWQLNLECEDVINGDDFQSIATAIHCYYRVMMFKEHAVQPVVSLDLIEFIRVNSLCPLRCILILNSMVIVTTTSTDVPGDDLEQSNTTTAAADAPDTTTDAPDTTTDNISNTDIKITPELKEFIEFLAYTSLHEITHDEVMLPQPQFVDIFDSFIFDRKPHRLDVSCIYASKHGVILG
jgi:hypothetical protein